MPSPERFFFAPEGAGHGPEPKEQEPQPYAKAAKFDRERHAKKAYDAAQEAIYRARDDVDLSSYRLLLNRQWYVAVVGQPPPEEVDRRIGRILSAGEPATLPPDVLSQLLARRAEATQIAPWVELHRDISPEQRPPEPPERPQGGGQR